MAQREALPWYRDGERMLVPCEYVYVFVAERM